MRVRYPYKTGGHFAATGARSDLGPYLSLVIKGPDGSIDVQGLIDTGSDTSALPLELAEILGFDEAEMQEAEGVSGGATFPVFIPARGVQAAVPGIEEQFELRPVFVEGLEEALWGRGDFLQTFTLTLSESERQFTLSWRGDPQT